jgi:hypothetical protein
MYNRGGKGTGGAAGRSAEADFMERQNDAMVGVLQNKIQNLKSVSFSPAPLPILNSLPLGPCPIQQARFQQNLSLGISARSVLLLELVSTSPRSGITSVSLFRFAPQITIAIGEEVRDQNKYLDEFQNGMAANDNLLGSTMKRMGVIPSSPNPLLDETHRWRMPLPPSKSDLSSQNAALSLISQARRLDSLHC